jgi:hypothetical protein
VNGCGTKLFPKQNSLGRVTPAIVVDNSQGKAHRSNCETGWSYLQFCVECSLTVKNVEDIYKV